MRPLPSPRPQETPADIAAFWVERLTSGAASEEEIAALKAWLAADPENRTAYEQARAVWAELPRTALKNRRPVLRLVGGTALAAGLAVLLMSALPQGDHVTGVGEISKLALADGTTAWLDSGSAIDVDFTASGRTVTLVKGRAAFAVAKDARPFAVLAGPARVTDIGTTFSVDRAGPLTVAVTQGEVEVAKGDAHTHLTADQAARFDADAPRRFAPGNSPLGWRDHRILLDSTPLRDALAELDRYQSGTIVLLDSAIGDRRVSGTVFIDRVGEGLDTIARSQHLKVTRLPWLTLVSAAD